MAVAVTPISVAGPNGRSWTVTATADADTTATITHGFPDANYMITLLPLIQAACALSLWAVTGMTNTTITLTKGVGVGSGAANPQLVVFVASAASRIMGA